MSGPMTYLLASFPISDLLPCPKRAVMEKIDKRHGSLVVEEISDLLAISLL